MTVLGIKLVTGEEIFGKTTTLPTGQLKVEVPVILRSFPPTIAGGQPSLGFSPFPPMSSHGKPVILEPLHIIYTFEPYAELIEEYHNMISGESQPQIITG